MRDRVRRDGSDCAGSRCVHRHRHIAFSLADALAFEHPIANTDNGFGRLADMLAQRYDELFW